MKIFCIWCKCEIADSLYVHQAKESWHVECVFEWNKTRRKLKGTNSIIDLMEVAA